MEENNKVCKVFYDEKMIYTKYYNVFSTHTQSILLEVGMQMPDIVKLAIQLAQHIHHKNLLCLNTVASKWTGLES